MLDYLRSEDGSSAAEYSVILAVIGAALVAAVLSVGPPIASRFTAAAEVIRSPNG